MEVKIKLLDGQMPVYSRERDACLDCYAAEDLTIEKGVTKKVKLGFALELPVGYEAQIRPRSGLSLIGLDVKLGTIDSNYRGEVSAIVQNNSTLDEYKILKGNRIAQMLIQKVEPISLIEVDALSDTNRGDNGFGSSGI